MQLNESFANSNSILVKMYVVFTMDLPIALCLLRDFCMPSKTYTVRYYKATHCLHD